MGTQKLWATNPGLPEVHIVSGGSRNEPENTVRGPAVSKGPRLGIGGARRDIGGAFPNIGGARAPPTIWKLASLPLTPFSSTKVSSAFGKLFVRHLRDV